MSDMAISNNLFNFILHNLTPAPSKVIWEFGSGDGTKRLIDAGYYVVSIEHDKQYVGLHHNRYIYAPIKKRHKPWAKFEDDRGWYDPDVLRRELPKYPKPDVILVDGPPNEWGRAGAVVYMQELLNPDAMIIFDDMQRTRTWNYVYRLSCQLKRPYTVYDCGEEKPFAVFKNV